MSSETLCADLIMQEVQKKSRLRREKKTFKIVKNKQKPDFKKLMQTNFMPKRDLKKSQVYRIKWTIVGYIFQGIQKHNFQYC